QFPYLPFADSGFTHVKLAASSVLPVPFHFATCGYGHSGRVRSTPLVGFAVLYFVAMICAGATLLSTHRSSAADISCSASPPGAKAPPKLFGPGPPPQCCMPGTMNRRTNWSASLAPILHTTFW